MPAYTRLPVMMLLVATCITACKKNVEPVAAEKPSAVSISPLPPNGNYWTQLNVPTWPGPPSTNDYHASFAFNNKIYVALHGLNQLWEYDPAGNGQWTPKVSPIFNFSPYEYIDAFTNGNHVYFLNVKTKKLKAYDIVNNQWTDKTDFPGTASSYVAATNTATKGYVMGGANGYHANTSYYITLNENWEYDFAANTWTQKANTPGFSRLNAAAHTIGDKIYFGTGVSVVPMINPNTLQFTWVPYMNSDWWEYNTVQNTWTQKTSFGGGGRQDTRGFVIGSKVYVGLGSSAYFFDIKSDLWEYNVSTNTWTQRASYPPGSVYPPWLSMLGVGSRGYAVFARLAEFWKYTPPSMVFPVN